MKIKAVSGIVLTLLFVGMLTLAFNIQPVEAEPKTWTVDDDGPADFHTHACMPNLWMCLL